MLTVKQYRELLAGVQAFEDAKRQFAKVVKTNLGETDLTSVYEDNLTGMLELSNSTIAKEMQFMRDLLQRQYVQEGQNTPIFQGRNLPADVLDSTKRRTFVDHRIQARKPPYDDRENNFPDPLPYAAKEQPC